METRHSSLRTRRFVAVGAAVALTGMMLAADPADAGHRRRNRCCCGTAYNHHAGYTSGYGGSYHGGYGANTAYGSNYAQSGQVIHSQSDYSGNQYGNTYNVPNEPQPNLADTRQQGQQQQGTQQRANRPITDESAPPAPSENRDSQQDDAEANSPQSGTQANVEQMRQRIQSLEQENARLRNQLQEARQTAGNESSADQQLSDRQADETDAADAEATASTDADAESESELPAPPAPGQ